MRTRLVARAGLGAIGGIFALGLLAVPAHAETDDDAPPADPGQIAAWVELFMNEFSNADLDGDGNADFADTDGDGIPDIPEGDPGDLDLRPGDGRFGTLVVEQLQESAEMYISDSEGSALIGDCSGMAISYDKDGKMVDWAIGVGSQEGGGPTGQLIDLYPPEDFGKRAFTKSHPYVFKYLVIYFGRLPGSGDGPRNHTWDLKTGPFSIDEGGDDNPAGDNRNAGEVSVTNDVPGGTFTLPTGVWPVTAHLESENGLTCWGDGYFRSETAFPLATGPGLAAAGLGIGAILGLLFNSRPAVTWKV